MYCAVQRRIRQMNFHGVKKKKKKKKKWRILVSFFFFLFNIYEYIIR